jgi:hypothetical protein
LQLVRFNETTNESAHLGHTFSQELLQFGCDRSPAGFEILPRIRRRFWKRFNSGVRQLQSRLIALGKQFKSYQRIARLAFVSPGISDLLLRNHFSDLAKVVISIAFMLDHEFKFKSDFRLKFLSVEIPLPHFIHVRERGPNSADWSIENALYNDSLRQIACCIHIGLITLHWYPAR